MPNAITLEGWTEGIAKLKAMPEILYDEIDGEVQDAAENWEGLAKAAAPVDQGALRNGISSYKVAQMNWETVSASEYSPYIEWGTRTKVRVPGELSAYAQQFKTGYQPGGAKKAIFAWMNRVGIPKERQWIVFLSIMIKGINPHPFFFPQKPIVERGLITNVDRILKTEH